MIIIRTANGCEFINDENISRVTHDKKKAEVCIYRGALPCTITQVVSVTYTTKKDVEFEDKGSLLTAALKDLDFNRQLSKMYEGYAKRLYESRNTLERFILRKHDNELSEETYKAFIINLLEERKQRQGNTLDEEFGTFDLDNWYGKKKNAEEFGKEVTSWFEDMTRQISEKTAENFKLNMEIRGKRRVIKQQQDEIERLKLRSLWERITRKGE
jgi:hypothetical protein